MNCCVRCRCKPENRAANVWNNEQLQLKAKQLLDSWQGPLYVQMNRTEASDFPSPIKRQIVKKGTHVHQNFYRQWSPIVSTVFLLHLECFKHVCDLQKVFSMQNCAVSRLQGPGLSGCLPCCPCFFCFKMLTTARVIWGPVVAIIDSDNTHTHNHLMAFGPEQPG